ncbi:class I SAM-dependent methyltransferase [Arenibaculum pallidiluteum]|uniref:class I SAM-dependent methyltransferase n=1 Tax=Arenibaculum pallidiluteum TaxID=2812559 RepID=UPI002E2C512C|nr:class I SAM-dependent methyltransferase [Arenibaculum pallidiluteum]
MTLPSQEPQPERNRVVVLRRRADDRLDWLCESIARNRLLPVPAAERQFVGDGDFRAIGAEFLRHFVRLGGLRPDHSVLEIGCGIGRMALPLTQYLEGSYDGVDVVEDGIRWCAETLTPAYPAFRFHHLDAANGVYNPAGRLDPARVTLPFADGAFDFVILTSVVTHLRRAETERYIAEIARLMRPGGRCFLSLFLVDETARAGLRAGTARPAFPADAAGPELLADPEAPHGAVAYDEDYLLGGFAAHGLRPARPVAHGHWSGARTAENFQDLLVLVRDGAEASQ